MARVTSFSQHAARGLEIIAQLPLLIGQSDNGAELTFDLD